MITTANKTLNEFTQTADLDIQNKADKTAVTACDKTIDEVLSKIAASKTGLGIVSEEGEHVLDIVKTGNYVTIDPIDGTLGYIEYVNYALEHGGITNFGQQDLGAASDFCLLVGIVEDGVPTFGAVYNYITKETILVSGNDKSALIRENNKRDYRQKNAVYVDQRPGDHIEDYLKSIPDVSVIKQAALGLKSIYTFINPHEAAITAHRVQIAGLWDIMPAAVAARAFGGQVFDDLGQPLQFKDYLILPGKGATIIRGEKFLEIPEMLSK